jgi:hypothetical protein
VNEVAIVREEPPGDEEGMIQLRDEIARLPPHLGAFIFAHGREVSASMNHYVWYGPRAGDEIAVIDDFDIPARYVAMRANLKTRLAELTEAVRSVVHHVSVENLRAHALAHVHDDPASLIRLALALVSADRASLAIFANGLKDACENVRYCALVATSLVRWPELLPDVRARAAAEVNEVLRRLAEHAVLACSSFKPE